MRPLAIGQPRHVVTRSDVDVARRELLLELAGDTGCFGNLLGLQSTPLQHIQKIGVATDIELAGALQPHPPVAEQTRQDAVDDRGADLTLDVIADDGQAVLLEAASPGSFTGDEYRDAVDYSAASRERL